MKSKSVTAILSILFVAPFMAGFVPTAGANNGSEVTLADTSCQSAVGVGPSDIPHAYYTANGIITFANDACPDHYSGELGFGVGGVWFFARAGADANGDGDGVVTCYGSTDPTAGPTTGHHGADTTIVVKDDNLGGAIAFTVTRDYNRSATNPQLPSSNDDDPNDPLANGSGDCGDNIVEPCTPEQEAETDPTSPNYVAGGCNSLDASTFVFPQDGICTGLNSLGDLFNPPTDPLTLATLIRDFLLGLLGLLPPPIGGSASCNIPAANFWTAPGTLGEYAGADGAIVIFLSSNFRADAGHFGTGTTGAAWTTSGKVPTGSCRSTNPLGYGPTFDCRYNDGETCWVYLSHDPTPEKPSAPDQTAYKGPKAGDTRCPA